jgi:hypothetical protein
MEFNPNFTYMLQSATTEGNVYHKDKHKLYVSIKLQESKKKKYKRTSAVFCDVAARVRAGSTRFG